MSNDVEYLKELMEARQQEIAPLLRYLPWLETASASSAMTMYRGEDADEHSLAFPVYDSTLMNFIKVASTSSLMDRNYPYVYTRKNIKTAQQERNIIETCSYKDWDVMRGILSRYVLGGRTKGVLWSEGVSEQIYYLILKKMDDIVTHWDAERNLQD